MIVLRDKGYRNPEHGLNVGPEGAQIIAQWAKPPMD